MHLRSNFMINLKNCALFFGVHFVIFVAICSNYLYYAIFLLIVKRIIANKTTHILITPKDKWLAFWFALSSLYNVFAYLKSKHNMQKIFDPTIPYIPEKNFCRQDWTNSVYNSAKDVISSNWHVPSGFGCIIRALVDSEVLRIHNDLKQVF